MMTKMNTKTMIVMDSPHDPEGDIEAKNDDRDESDATPKYRILELLLRKSVK